MVGWIQVKIKGKNLNIPDENTVGLDFHRQRLDIHFYQCVLRRIKLFIFAIYRVKIMKWLQQPCGTHLNMYSMHMEAFVERHFIHKEYRQFVQFCSHNNDILPMPAISRYGQGKWCQIYPDTQYVSFGWRSFSFPDKSCCIIVLPSSGYLWVSTSNDAKNPVKISMSPKYSYSKGIKILCHGPISHCFLKKNPLT